MQQPQYRCGADAAVAAAGVAARAAGVAAGVGAWAIGVADTVAAGIGMAMGANMAVFAE